MAAADVGSRTSAVKVANPGAAVRKPGASSCPSFPVPPTRTKVLCCWCCGMEEIVGDIEVGDDDDDDDDILSKANPSTHQVD